MNGILSWDKAYVHPEGLRERMIAFSLQSVASMIVALIVWDRSEIFLLNKLCVDIRQIAFYSVAFSMAERLLITSQIFSSASSVTLFAQYGRDKSRLADITASTFRYLALTSIPVHVISAALAFPALMLLYGNKYKDAAMVVTLAPLLCMPKAFISPVQSLLQSIERQSYIIFATIFAGIVDIGVAWYLIPKHGAVGACIGSGTAQVAAVGMMWVIGIRLYSVKLPWLQVAKVTFCSVLASLTAHYIAVSLTPLWGILCGGTASLIVLFGLFYLLRVLEPEDRTRFSILTGMLPKPIAGPAEKMVSLLIRPDFASAAPTNV
jgi:O-antigen/teichoic acid export membrane protein